MTGWSVYAEQGKVGESAFESQLAQLNLLIVITGRYFEQAL